MAFSGQCVHLSSSSSRREEKSRGREESYGASLRLEPISPTPADPVLLEPEIVDTQRQVVRLLDQKAVVNMNKRGEGGEGREGQVIDCNWTLKALNETYEQFRNALPQKQKEYHELVISAHKSANFPFNRLSAPLLLAKEQQKLIEHQFGVTSGQRMRLINTTPPHLQQQHWSRATEAPPPPPPLHSHLVAIGSHPHTSSHAPPPHPYGPHVRHVMTSGHNNNGFVQTLSRDLNNTSDQRVSSLLQNNSRAHYNPNTVQHVPQHVQTCRHASQQVINNTRAQQHVPGMRRESPIRLNPNLSITTTTVNTSTFQTKPSFTSHSVIRSHVSPQQHARQSVVQNSNNSVLLSRLKAPLMPSSHSSPTNSNCAHTHQSASVTPITLTPPLSHAHRQSNGLHVHSGHRSPHVSTHSEAFKSGVIIQPIIGDPGVDSGGGEGTRKMHQMNHVIRPQMTSSMSHEKPINLFKWSQNERLERMLGSKEPLLDNRPLFMSQQQLELMIAHQKQQHNNSPDMRHFRQKHAPQPPPPPPPRPSLPYRAQVTPYAAPTAHSPRRQMAVVNTTSSPLINPRLQQPIGGQVWRGGVAVEGVAQQSATTVRQMLEKQKSKQNDVNNTNNRRSGGVVIPYNVTQQIPPLNGGGVGGVATISPVLRPTMGLREFRMAFETNGQKMSEKKDENNNRIPNGVPNEESVPLNLKKAWKSEAEEEVVIISEMKRSEDKESQEVVPQEENNSSDSSSDSIRLRISETPPKCDQILGSIDGSLEDLPKIKNKEEEEEEEEESEEEFGKRVEKLVQRLCEKSCENNEKEKGSEGKEMVPKMVPKSDLWKSLERNHKNFLETEFVLNLNLIKSRDLRRKPRAYLNAKYPLNDISRSIYAGIATKKAVMDFPSTPPEAPSVEETEAKGSAGEKRKRKCYSLKPKRGKCGGGDCDARGVDEEEEPNKWAFVLQNIDLCSPLSQRIVGVLPNFQFK